MSNAAESTKAIATAPLSFKGRFVQWVQEPMGSVIAASVATMSSLGFVLSGMWFISSAIN
jgi:hypothetical protein